MAGVLPANTVPGEITQSITCNTLKICAFKRTEIIYIYEHQNFVWCLYIL